MARTPRYSSSGDQSAADRPNRTPILDDGDTATTPVADRIDPPVWHRAYRRNDNATNTAPVANADQVTTSEDKPVTFSPLANDTDASGNAVLHLADGNDLTLIGVSVSNLTASSLFVTA